MLRYLGIIPILGLFLLPAAAQEEEQTPYEIALQSIEEARASGATELDLLGLGLTELPAEIGDLNTLISLDLSKNQLSSLPTEIIQLSNLQILRLGGNQFIHLGPEIGSLSNLRELYLDNNPLVSLPAEIGQLSNLLVLELGFSELNSLPTEISQLSSLTVLSVPGNELNSLPPEIGQLSNLCYLDLSDNNLQNLPEELGQLPLLTIVDCDYIPAPYAFLVRDNPLSELPEDVIRLSPPEILAYLRNEAWWHLQRLIAGGASVLGIATVALLGLRWRNRRYTKKKRA